MAVAAAEEDALENLLGCIPTRLATPTATTPESQSLQCCCGHPDCAYLKHNCNALANLEKEVHTAAALGQALLARHEHYMQDAERDRKEMNAKIEQLENDKKELEDENARNIEENRALLEHLEAVNTTVADSETHVESLEATLESTRQELRHLEDLASRTHDLEIQLAALEQEQNVLQNNLVRTQADERSAIRRWRNAERRLSELQDQLERIEREAQEERGRHVEILGRMERQRVVERELGTAAGRLKAAAATTGKGKNGSNVVSHFVKDILQDNANLQMGIVELRGMLMSSNDEVQALREQLMLHQPLEIDDGNGSTTLNTELDPKEPPEQPAISQELHIHHHYHVPKKEDSRRPKKKRGSINTALFSPPKTAQRSSRTAETTGTILSQTAVTIPTSPTTSNRRWSIQSSQMSDFAPSSVPSSPQSMYRNSTLFDRGLDFDSRPTSPGSSIDPMSPQFQPLRHRKRGSEVSTRSFVPPTNFQPHNVIQEEDDDVQEICDLQNTNPPCSDEGGASTDASQDLDDPSNSNLDWDASFQPPLRRTSSHESIISTSGTVIHTLKHRPSQLTVRGNAAFYAPHTRLGSPTSTVSLDTTITTRSTLSRNGHDSTSYLRSSIPPTSSDARSIMSGNSNEGQSSGGPGLGVKLGGWVLGRWGVSPAKSSGDLRSANQYRSVSSPTVPPQIIARPPGINQKGPIPGFLKKIERAPSNVKPEAVDHDALREVFVEGESGPSLPLN